MVLISNAVMSYDNACNMNGKYCGFQAGIKEVNKYVEYILCFTYSLNLVAESLNLVLQNLYKNIHFLKCIHACIHSFLLLYIIGAFFTKALEHTGPKPRFWKNCWTSGVLPKLMQQRHFYLVLLLSNKVWMTNKIDQNIIRHMG